MNISRPVVAIRLISRLRSKRMVRYFAVLDTGFFIDLFYNGQQVTQRYLKNIGQFQPEVVLIHIGRPVLFIKPGAAHLYGHIKMLCKHVSQ